MLKAIIYDLKDIHAEHLLSNFNQPYSEGVDYALHDYNIIVTTKPVGEIENAVKMKLAHAYADFECGRNNAEKCFQQGSIDFYEYILDYE